MEILRFVSNVASYDVPDDAAPYDAIVDDLRVVEEWAEHSDKDLPAGVKAYRVSIEAKVGSLSEVREAWERISDLIAELDQVWPYVAGEPLQPVRLMIRLGDGPSGWSSNFRSLESHFAKVSRSPLGFGEAINRHWTKMPTPPLRQALKGRIRLRSLHNPHKLLHELHYSALKTTDRNAELFILAKCLEILRSILLGRDDAERHKSLDEAIQRSVTNSLHQLFMLANKRLDVRHAVQNPVGPTFHPEMTVQERVSFVDDATTIVRGVLCGVLELPVISIRPYSDLANETA